MKLKIFLDAKIEFVNRFVNYFRSFLKKKRNIDILILDFYTRKSYVSHFRIKIGVKSERRNVILALYNIPSLRV